MYTYIYIYIYTHIYVYIYIYIFDDSDDLIRDDLIRSETEELTSKPHLFGLSSGTEERQGPTMNRKNHRNII